MTLAISSFFKLNNARAIQIKRQMYLEGNSVDRIFQLQQKFMDIRSLITDSTAFIYCFSKACNQRNRINSYS